jgi:hypothetical protein
MSIPLLNANWFEYRIPGIYLESVDDSETPNLVQRRAEETKRRLEREIGKRTIAVIERRVKREQQRLQDQKRFGAELLKQVREELKKPYRWQDEPWMMYYPGMRWY